MQALLSAATDLVVLLSPDKAEAIADRVRGMWPLDRDRRLHQIVSTPSARSALDRLLTAWKQVCIPGDVLAGIILGASHAHQKTKSESTIELVWTGPTTPFVATRRTEQVLLDLIRRSQAELFLVSFVAYDVPAVVNELNHACDRGVDVRILLEASSRHGGSLSVDPIAMVRRQVPSALLYAWIERLSPFIDGRVHAKVAVADSDTAFLTSANLTGHAFEKKMEAGVVIFGGSIPGGLRSHLHALIETKIIQRV